MTYPFPDHFQSLEDITEYSKRHRVMGFNRQSIRAYILWRVFKHFHCTSFVETGTGYGHTSGFVRRAFNTAVLTCEINVSDYLISKLNLAWAGPILSSRSSSPDFLRKACHQALVGSNPMFYLDAHCWYEDTPLPNELLIIAERCKKGLVVIDDFFVPSEPRFGWDKYTNLRADINVINMTLKARREDVSVYLPAYNPSREPAGRARGMAVVLMGQDKELPIETFPFNLLAPV